MVYSRIFLFSLLCSFFQIVHSASQCYLVGTTKFNTPETACASFWAQYPNGTNKTYYFDTTGAYTGKLRCYIFAEGNNNQAYNIVECDNNCPPLNTNSGTAFFKFNGEVFNAPSQVCINKCLYNYTNTVIGQEVRSDGHIMTTTIGDTISQKKECTDETKSDEPPPLNPCKQYDSKTDSYAEKDYCQQPDNVACPPGYVSGIFNAKNVCVKSKTNDQDNCTPTASDPYKCLPTKPQEPTDPDANNNCPEGTVQVLIGSTLKCATQEVPPDPDGHCPDNYVKQTFDGVSVCVPNNQRPDSNNNCPLNTSLVTLSDGSNVCRSGNGGDGSGASEPTTGTGDCNPETDFLCKDFELPTNNKLDVKDIQLPEINENKISWSQSCPADHTLTIRGKTYAFKYNEVCNFLSTYINPLIVAFGYLSGAFIIIGAVRK